MKQEKKHKSIGQRLGGVHTYEGQFKILSDWKNAWESDFNNTVRMIENELKAGRVGAAMVLVHQLKSLSEKKFIGLGTVIKKVSDPERVLKVDREIPKVDSPSPEQTSKVDSPAQPNKTEKVFWGEPIKQVKEQKDLDIEEMVHCYNAGIGTNKIAEDHGISQQKVTKILITAGVYSSERYDLIKRLRERGLSEEEVADTAGISMKVLSNYTPYAKGIYGLTTDASENALKIRKYRDSQRNDD